MDGAIERAAGLAHGGRHVHLSAKEEEGRAAAERAVEEMEDEAGEEEVVAAVEVAWRAAAARVERGEEGGEERSAEREQGKARSAEDGEGEATGQGGQGQGERGEGGEVGKKAGGKAGREKRALASVLMAEIGEAPLVRAGVVGRKGMVGMLREVLTAEGARGRGGATGAMRALLQAHPEVEEVHILVRAQARQQEDARGWLKRAGFEEAGMEDVDLPEAPARGGPEEAQV